MKNLFSSAVDINLISDESFQAEDFELPIKDSKQVEVVHPKLNLRPAIRWVLYVAIALTPLFFLPWTSELFELNKQSLLIVAAGVGLILFLLEVIQNSAVVIRTSRLYLPIVALLLAAVVSSVLSKNLYQSLLGVGGGVTPFSLATLAALSVIFFLLLNVIEDYGKMLKQVVVISLDLTFLVVVLEIFGFFLVNKAPFNSYSFNTVGSLNSLALLGALLLPLFLETKLKLFKWFDLAKVGVGLILFLVILVNWWIVWLAVFTSLLAWIVFKILETGKAKVRIYIFPMFVAVIGSSLMLINFSMPVLKIRLPTEVAVSFQSSVDVIRATLKEKPISGYGLGEFMIAYDKFRPKSVAKTIFARAHFTQAASSVLTLVVEGGAVIAIALLFLLVMLGWELYHSQKRNSFLALATVVLLFLFPYNITLLLFFFLGLVFLELESHTSKTRKLVFEDSPKYSLVSALAFIVGLVVVLAGGYFTVLRYVSDSYYVQALRGTDADVVITDFTKGININTKDIRAYRLMSQAVIIKLGNDLKDKADKTPAKERIARLQNLAASAIDIAKRATDLEPDNVENWLNRALVYQNLVGVVGGADQATISMYQEALKRMPTDPVIYHNIGAVYLTVAENTRLLVAAPPKDQPNLNLDALKQRASDIFAKAEENYKKAIELNNNYGQALFALGVVYEREGKLPESIKQFERLRVANPNDPSIAFELGLLYYRNGQKDAAFAQLQQAVTLFPNYSNARWYLSLLYEEKGDIASALAQTEEILKTNLDNELVKQRIAQLSAGKRLIPPAKVLDQKPL